MAHARRPVALRVLHGRVQRHRLGRQALLARLLEPGRGAGGRRLVAVECHGERRRAGGGRRGVDAHLRVRLGAELRRAARSPHLDVLADLLGGPPEQPADAADELDSQRQRTCGTLSGQPVESDQLVATVRLSGPRGFRLVVRRLFRRRQRVYFPAHVLGVVPPPAEPDVRLRLDPAVADALAALHVEPDRAQPALQDIERLAVPVPRGGPRRPRVRPRPGPRRVLLDAVPRPVGAARLRRLDEQTAVVRLPLDPGSRADKRPVVAVPLRVPLAQDTKGSAATVRPAAQVEEGTAPALASLRRTDSEERQEAHEDAALAQPEEAAVAQTRAGRRRPVAGRDTGGSFRLEVLVHGGRAGLVLDGRIERPGRPAPGDGAQPARQGVATVALEVERAGAIQLAAHDQLDVERERTGARIAGRRFRADCRVHGRRALVVLERWLELQQHVERRERRQSLISLGDGSPRTSGLSCGPAGGSAGRARVAYGKKVGNDFRLPPSPAFEFSSDRRQEQQPTFFVYFMYTCKILSCVRVCTKRPVMDAPRTKRSTEMY